MNYVKFEAKDLASKLKIIIAVIERRNSIPILSYVRITSSKSGAKLTGTDLDMFATIEIERLDYKGNFDLCLEARALYNIARSSGVMGLTISEDGKIVSDNAEYSLSHLPAGDFPGFPGEDSKTLIADYENGEFSNYLSKVKNCISTEEARYYLKGICWEGGKEGEYFVATDGHRLMACKASDGKFDAFSRIIPRKAVLFIIQHLKGMDVSVYGHGYPSPAIRIVAGGLTLRTKLIDGTYPDWKRIIVKDADREFKLNRIETVNAIKSATAVASKHYRMILLRSGKGNMVISCNSPDYGNASIKTQAAWAGECPDFAVNHVYFSSMIKGCSDTFHVIKASDPMAPISFKDDDDRMIRLLMPMRN